MPPSPTAAQPAIRALITGASGAVGIALSARLRDGGHAAVAWDRRAVTPGDHDAACALLDRERPSTIFHLAVAASPMGLDDEYALVNARWPAMLGALARERGIRFVFSSTVSVFTDEAAGPHALDDAPDANGGYGGEKAQAERELAEANPDAVIARLGWQIGSAPGSNNMVDFMERTMREKGVIEASTEWRPACSYVDHTADALIGLAQDHGSSGLYQLDSNRGWSFFQIASALNDRHGGPWRIEPADAPAMDHRMIDHRVEMPPLRAHLPTLPPLGD